MLDDFAAAFEALAVAPRAPRQPPASARPSSSNKQRSPPASYEDGDDLDGDVFAYTSDLDNSERGHGRPPRGAGRNTNDGFGGGQYSHGEGAYGRSAGSGSYGSMTKSGRGWSGRGKQEKGKGKAGPTLEDFENVDLDSLSPAKRQILAELQAEADKAERRRLMAKQRSERIPTAPKPRQDPIIFQAMTRQWDEKMTPEEQKGARASARKIARVGLYDRNYALKAVRRKAVQALQKKPLEDLTEEERIIALRAQEIREAAAAKSIQRSKEELAQEAKGVSRSYARAQELPPDLWEELKTKYRSEVTQMKIGRRGASPSLVQAIQAAWRGAEVVKLRIHDDKSARKMNLPRLNLLLRELEEMTGGVLLDAAGSSIWLYRGVDWQPPPPPAVYKPPPAEDMLQEQYTPRGTWHDIGGVTCYVASSGDSSDAADNSSSSSSGSSNAGGRVVPAAGDAMTVLMLPDHFALADSQPLLQVADKIASKGVLVVLADLLGAPPSAVNSNINKGGQARAGAGGTSYWHIHRWPLVKRRKLEYMEWYQTGPGSYTQLRPNLGQLLEEMQAQGLYSRDAPTPTPTAADTAAADAASSSDSSSSSGGSSEQQQQQQAAPAGRPLGLLGIGWGSFIGLHVVGDGALVADSGVRGMVALSPATYNKDYDLSVALKVPVCLLPAKYDTMDQVVSFINLLAKPWELRCVFKRFGKLKPGWSSWLPQWTDPRAMRQVAEQTLTGVSWLKRELLGVVDGYDLPVPQLPAKAGAASAAELGAAVKKAEKQAAAEQAAAEAEAGGNESDE